MAPAPCDHPDRARQADTADAGDAAGAVHAADARHATEAADVGKARAGNPSRPKISLIASWSSPCLTDVSPVDTSGRAVAAGEHRGAKKNAGSKSFSFVARTPQPPVLVRLVRDAEGRRAPLLRMADRYAAVFVPFTLAAAGLAWALSGDPRARPGGPRGRDPLPADHGSAGRPRRGRLEGGPTGVS